MATSYSSRAAAEAMAAGVPAAGAGCCLSGGGFSGGTAAPAATFTIRPPDGLPAGVCCGRGELPAGVGCAGRMCAGAGNGGTREGTSPPPDTPCATAGAAGGAGPAGSLMRDSVAPRGAF